MKVAYLDVSGTIDTVMKSINVLKMENAAVVLGGVKLGSKKGMSYNELVGIIGQMLQRIVSSRLSVISANAANGEADAPLLSRDITDSELRETLAARATKKKAAVKKEDQSSDDDGDDEDEDDPSVNARSNGGSKSHAKHESKTTSLSSTGSSLFDDESDDDLLNAESIFQRKGVDATGTDEKNEAHFKTEASHGKEIFLVLKQKPSFQVLEEAMRLSSCFLLTKRIHMSLRLRSLHEPNKNLWRKPYPCQKLMAKKRSRLLPPLI